MAEFSRVKKYEQLRKDIETNQTQTSINRGSMNYHEDSKEEESYTPTHEKVFSQSNDNNGNDTSSFKNEYLDSFIQEVREYNIQKGIRESEDTKLDILQQLTTKNRERRANYIEKMDDDISESTPEVSNTDVNVEGHGINVEGRNEETLEISRQVFDLLNETEVDMNNSDEIIEEKESAIPENEVPNEIDNIQNEALSEINKEENISLDDRIAQLEKEIHHTQVMQNDDFKLDQADDEEEISEITKKELLEQTMQLKVKIDQYENELSEINSGVDSNNRLLNIVIIVLIVALLAVIGVVAYWLISGGII